MSILGQSQDGEHDLFKLQLLFLSVRSLHEICISYQTGIHTHSRGQILQWKSPGNE